MSEKYQFHGFPRFYPRTAYQAAVEGYLDTVRDCKAIRSVYEIGRVGIPGISDIDLLIVLEPASRLSFRVLSIMRYDDVMQYLFMHDPLVFGADFAGDLCRWGYYEDGQLNRLYGDALPIASMSAQEKNDAYSTMLVEHLILRYPRDLLQMQLDQVAYVRGTLCHLNSYKHLFHLFECSVGSPRESWMVFSERFARFRNGWFDLDAESQRRGLMRFIDEATQVGLELIEDVSRYLNQSQRVSVSTDRSCSSTIGFWSRGVLTVFEPEWSVERCRAVAEAVHRRAGLCVMVLPWNMQYLLQLYVSCSGPVSRYIFQFYNGNGLNTSKVEVGLQDAGKARCRMMNRHFEFLSCSRVLHPGSNFVSWGRWVDHTWKRRVTRPIKYLYRLLCALYYSRLLSDIIVTV